MIVDVFVSCMKTHLIERLLDFMLLLWLLVDPYLN